MRGTAYAIFNHKGLVAISLSRLNAQEMLMEFAFDDSYETYHLFLPYGHKVAMREAKNALVDWRIKEFDLV